MPAHVAPSVLVLRFAENRGREGSRWPAHFTRKIQVSAVKFITDIKMQVHVRSIWTAAAMCRGSVSSSRTGVRALV